MSTMLLAIKSLAHAALNKIGIEVRLIRNVRHERQEQLRQKQYIATIRDVGARWSLLAGRTFATIIDIGANEGQFSSIARRIWPDAKLIAFEPLPDIYDRLVANFSADRQFEGVNVALASDSGVVKMFRSASSLSSSILPMAETHKKEWPHTSSGEYLQVEMVKLDDWVRERESHHSHPVLIKIDVQGYEAEVIAGGRETIKSAALVLIEVSYHELYVGQPLFSKIHEMMEELGFIYRGSLEQVFDHDGWRILYADAIFENTRCEGIC
jgi:FkbM family methyltransferase